MISRLRITRSSTLILPTPSLAAGVTLPTTTQESYEQLAGKYTTVIESFLAQLQSGNDQAAYDHAGAGFKKGIRAADLTKYADSHIELRQKLPLVITNIEPIIDTANQEQTIIVTGNLGGTAKSINELTVYLVQEMDQLKVDYINWKNWKSYIRTNITTSEYVMEGV